MYWILGLVENRITTTVPLLVLCTNVHIGDIGGFHRSRCDQYFLNCVGNWRKKFDSPKNRSFSPRINGKVFCSAYLQFFPS